MGDLSAEHAAAWADATKAIRATFPDRSETMLAMLEASCPRCAGALVLPKRAADVLKDFAGKSGPGGLAGAFAGALVGAALGSAASDALLPAARSRPKK